MARILIVDDESAILNLLSAAFRKAGYETTAAKSGEQALEICRTAKFDAVLSDVSMTGIDGHQTVSQIRRLMPHVASVLMSGFHMECTGACGLSTRSCTWLQKPFSPSTAVATVAESLAAGNGATASEPDCISLTNFLPGVHPCETAISGCSRVWQESRQDARFTATSDTEAQAPAASNR